MDSHPKKKKKNQYRANQKSIHGHVVGRENQIQSIQSKSKPNPITQYCNTNLFIKKKKQKNPIQRKPNPRRRANQTHGETVTSLAGAACFVARRPRLVVIACLPRLVIVTRPPLVVARREGLVADRRRSQIADRCSAAPVLSVRPQGISLSFSL